MPPVNVVLVLVQMEVAEPLVFPAITGFTVTKILVATSVHPPEVIVLLKLVFAVKDAVVFFAAFEVPVAVPQVELSVLLSHK